MTAAQLDLADAPKQNLPTHPQLWSRLISSGPPLHLLDLAPNQLAARIKCTSLPKQSDGTW